MLANYLPEVLSSYALSNSALSGSMEFLGLDVDFFNGRFPSQMTTTRSTVGNTVGSNGLLTSVGVNLPRFDHVVTSSRTNWIRNSVAAGGSAPATAPTNWSTSISAPATRTLAFGTEFGMPYVEVTVLGTPAGSPHFSINFEATTGIAAAVGQTWTLSGYIRLVRGSVTTGLTGLGFRMLEIDSGSATLATRVGPNIQASVTSALQRFSYTFTLADAATAFVRPLLSASGSGSVVDYTIRIYQPQMELSSAASTDIPTNGSVVTVFGTRTLGMLVESSRTNLVLHNRNLTNAAWVKTSCTAAQDQTGIDGVANSASTLTATGANATCLQSITSASAARWQSAYVRRVTGTGTIEMTMDNGTTWTAITITGSWTRYSIPAQTVTDPVVGFRIVTSGDAIAVDFVQNEVTTTGGPGATSPIGTTAASVVRGADNMRITNLNTIGFNAAEGSMFVEFELKFNGGGIQRVLSFHDGTGTNVMNLTGTSSGCRFIVVVGGVTQADLNVGTLVADTVYRVAFRWGPNNFAASLDGGSVITDSSGTVPTVTTLQFGSDQAGGNNLNGCVRRVGYVSRALPDTELRNFGA